ncbi:angiotensin-converting enzyme-domain-containing protein, partial [Blastocladiella britannica]
PVAFRGGAADFFHEAIGDAIALSVMTPGHLREIGLAPPDDAKASKRGSDGEEEMNAADKTAINTLMRVALSKLAFMPFAYAVDKWRWAAAREDQVTPENYTASWWTTVAAFQGLKPPVERGAAADAAGMLDAGAKYHVAAHVPYLRYFGAHVLEFQLHRAACRASGWPSHRPLHECSISQSKAAGDRIAAMLGLGASVPWPEAIGVATGGQEHELDATAMVQYLQPLLDWLRKENLRHEGGDEDETCAWDGMTDGSHLRRRRRR